MHIPVIFEDSDILVLDKPSGVVVHPFDFSDEETVLDFIKETRPDILSIQNEFTLQDGRTVTLGGLAHKLDRDTSGVLICARNQETFESLREQFANQEVKKTYVALVEGIIKEVSFTIDAPLGRGKKDYKQSTTPHNPRGSMRDAITEVRVLKRNQDTTLVELSPRTGRTHQLRAHMASIGHPIAGDIAYGSKIASERIMLHAASLTCTVGNIRRTFTSPLPEVFILHP